MIENTVTFMLDKERPLHFNFTTYRAFKQASSKQFARALMELGEAARTNPEDVDIEMILLMVWAACHEYDGKVATWPLSVDEVGSYLSMDRIGELVEAITTGYASNAPKDSEVESTTDRPTPA